MIQYLIAFILAIAFAGAYTMPVTCACPPEAYNETIIEPVQSYNMTAGDTFFVSLTPTPTPAIQITPIPAAYPKASDLEWHVELDCEKMAKDAQEKYGGSLVFLVGKDTNNQYILGDYAGHWINKIYIKELGKIQYIDYQTQWVYDDLKDALMDFKLYKGYPDAEAFDMEEGRPPFNLVWHY